jgi:transposase-like protein
MDPRRYSRVLTDHNTPRCPACKTPGVARKVECSLGQRTVRYECPACHNEWLVTGETTRPSGWTSIPETPLEP